MITPCTHNCRIPAEDTTPPHRGHLRASVGQTGNPILWYKTRVTYCREAAWRELCVREEDRAASPRVKILVGGRGETGGWQRLPHLSQSDPHHQPLLTRDDLSECLLLTVQSSN